jgi:ATP-dependent DNA helicase RecQ
MTRLPRPGGVPSGKLLRGGWVALRDCVEVDWKQILRLARERFGVDQLRPGQRELIEAVLRGEDALGLLPTGAGKSLCYQLPSLLLPQAVVVVSPLIALMQDQQEKLLQEANIEAAKLDSTLTAGDERAVRAEIRQGEHPLIYVTPERLENPDYLRLLQQGGVSLFVVDEAHCVSQWGHDFRPAYLSLRDAIRQLGRPPVLALTATSTPEVTADILRQLAIEGAHIVETGIDRPNLAFEVLRTVNGQAKRRRLQELLAEEPGSGIVYASTVRTVNELHRWLSSIEPRTSRYHGKLPKREREEAQRRFMSGEHRLMVATKAFGLGIDKPDIRFVIHYQFPDSIESYYQEAGRAGRDGKSARAVVLYQVEDRRVQAFFLGGKYPRRDESQRVYDAIPPVGGAAAVSAVIEAAGIGQRRARVVIAQLAGSGVVERRGNRLHRLRDFHDGGELEQFLREYEERHRGDRERLEMVMRYAETGGCRVRFLENYFGEAATDACGRCDNCRHPPVAATPPRQIRRRRRSAPPSPRPQFSPGEEVTHQRFGPGQVVAVEGDTVTVAFFRGKQRRVRASYLARAESAHPN